MSARKAGAGKKASSSNHSQEAQAALNEASLKLFHVRALLDLLHESVSHRESTVTEMLDPESWPGLFHSMLTAVEEAKDLIDSAPRVKS